MVTSRDLVPATSSPVCPRCDSELVVPAIAGGPSESVLQLRSSTAPVGRRDASGEWLCRSCGLRWPYERTTAVVASAAGELEPEPSGSPGELIDLGIEAKIVEKSGAWLSYGDLRIGQGRENARQFLKDNTDIRAAVDTELRKHLGLIKPDPVVAEQPQPPAPNGKAAAPPAARR